MLYQKPSHRLTDLFEAYFKNYRIGAPKYIFGDCRAEEVKLKLIQSWRLENLTAGYDVLKKTNL